MYLLNYHFFQKKNQNKTKQNIKAKQNIYNLYH